MAQPSRKHGPASLEIPLPQADSRDARLVAVRQLHPLAKVRNALTAAAKRIKRDDPKKEHQPESWASEAWAFYDQVGELRYAANTQAQAVGRLKFQLARTDENGETIRLSSLLPEQLTSADKIALQAMDDLGGESPTGMAELVRKMALSLFITGDALLVGCPRQVDPDELPVPLAPGEEPVEPRLMDLIWKAYSREEVQESQGLVKIHGKSYDPDEVLQIRIWNPHPRYGTVADSPTRAVMPVLRELVGLTMHISACIDSRLAGAGMVILPKSVETLGQASLEENEDGDSVIDNIIETIVTPIKDRDSAAAVVPYFVTVPDDIGFQPVHMTFSTPFDAMTKELRDESIRRLALGLDMPPEVLLGLSTSCVDMETQALTRQGWKYGNEVEAGDEVLTLNHDTGLSEWQTVQYMNRFEVVDEAMLRMVSSSHDSCTTSNHRWPIIKTGRKVSGSRRRWTTSGQGFTSTDRVPVAAPLNEGVKPTKWADDFVRLLVAFTGDGSVRSNGRIVIAKFAEREISEMRRILTSLYSTEFAEYAHPTHTATGVAFHLSREAGDELLAQCLPGRGKAIKCEFVHDLTYAQCELFLRSCVEIGDGVYKDGALLLEQALPERLDAFELAAILTGHKVTRGVADEVRGFGRVPLSRIYCTKARTVMSPWGTEQTTETYTGTVWCPTTPNGTWLARRHGTTWYTGNSHWNAWAIQDDYVKFHVVPPGERISDALVREYLRPVMVESGIAELVALDYWIETDPSDLVERPNRHAEALALFQAGVLSAPSLLKASGFEIADAPPESEGLPISVLRALELLAGAPSLALDPGLPSLVAQLQMVLTTPEAELRNLAPAGTPGGPPAASAGPEPGSTAPSEDGPDQPGPPADPEAPDPAADQELPA